MSKRLKPIDHNRLVQYDMPYVYEFECRCGHVSIDGFNKMMDAIDALHYCAHKHGRSCGKASLTRHKNSDDKYRRRVINAYDMEIIYWYE